MSRSSSLSQWLTLPCWFLTLMAAGVYALGVYGLPNLSIERPLLAALASGTPSLAKPVSIALLLLSAGSAIRSIFMRQQRQKLLSQQNGIETIRSLSWSRFEQLVGEAYRQQGYQVRENGGAGPDEGIDLSLTRDGTRTLVQCKHWRSSKVGVSVVREHLGVMTAHKAHHGVIVCTGEFTAPAIAFATANGIELVNGEALVCLVKQVQGATTTAPVKAGVAPALLVHPACPRCESPMLERVAKQGARAGSTFLGCSTYPACRGTRDV